MASLLKQTGSGDAHSYKSKRDSEGEETADTPATKAVGFAMTGRGSARRSQATSSRSSLSCVLCGRKHLISACWTFRGMSVPQRWRTAKSARACYVCLSRDHMASKCESPYKICGLKGCSQQHSRWLYKGRDGKQHQTETKRTVSLSSAEAPNKRMRMDEADD